MTVVIISRGLTGDLSAKTLLMVQSLAEIAKQIVFVSYGSCALFGKRVFNKTYRLLLI